MTADQARSEAEQAWRTAVTKVLKGDAPETLTAKTRDGIAIAALYPASDATGPGAWREAAQAVGILQRVDHPDPDTAKPLARAELDNGANGLVLVGMGSVCGRGFGLASHDLISVLDGLPLWTRDIRLEFAPHERAAAAEALLTQADRDGFAPASLHVDFGFDPLDAPNNLEQTANRLRALAVDGPIVRADGRPYHEAGGSEAQELAAVLASGVAGLRALEPLGLDVARDALSFTLAADADFMLTVAKLRALRRLWAHVEQACGLAPRPMCLHAETAWRMLSKRDPHTNILRCAVATAAAILGGADSVTVLPFTSALGLPDGFARRLARNTALVLLQEANLARVVDPAAGSGAFEAVTDALARETWTLFQDLERQGGLAAVLASGDWPRAVATKRAERQSAIADGQMTLVGVTRYRDASDARPTTLMKPAEPSGSTATLPSVRDSEAFEEAE